MKYSISKLMGSLALGSLLLAACNNAEYSELTDQAFIAQTNTDGNTSTKITVGTTAVSQDIKVRLSSPATVSHTFELVYDTLALKQYNQRNQTEYKALPDTVFSLSSSTITIDAGKVISSSIQLTVKPLADALKNSGMKYAIPLVLKSKDGQVGVLNSGGTIVYIIDQVVRQPVPVIDMAHSITFTMRKEYALSAWTVEMCGNMDQLGTAVGQLNNQMLFGGWAPSGKDGEIYTRFGDAPIEGNRLQVKTQGTQLNSNKLFDANKWYHIAFVCEGTKLSLYVDGKLDNSMDLPGKIGNISNSMSFATTSYFKAHAQVSALRFWTKARTQNEIANNMYVCDPKSDGLEAYWKMNEGQGDILNDATGHGNTGKIAAVPTWNTNVRIDGKE